MPGVPVRMEHPIRRRHREVKLVASHEAFVYDCMWEKSYDFNSEEFRVSLLKHEAQHARDLLRHKDMPLEELEYRAKLVELIYTEKRNLLRQFLREADSSNLQNGHLSAAAKILAGFHRKTELNPGEIENISTRQVQAVAKELLAEDNIRLRDQTSSVPKQR